MSGYPARLARHLIQGLEGKRVNTKPRNTWSDEEITLWVQKKFDQIPDLGFTEFQRIFNPLSKERLIQLIYNDYLESKVQRYNNVQNLVQTFKLKEEQIANKKARAKGGKLKAENTPQGKAKIEIKKLFETWESTKRINGKLYATDTAFAKHATANTVIKHDDTIKRWVREWRKSARLR